MNKLFFFKCAIAIALTCKSFNINASIDCLKSSSAFTKHSFYVPSKRLKTNKFNTRRALSSNERDFGYFSLFGEAFKSKLKQLLESETWLDAGTGDGNAILEYYESDGQAKTIGIVFEETSGYLLQKNKFPANNTFLSGRLIEDIPNKELGKVNLITDVYGPLAYTKDLTTILEKYLTLMEKDSLLFFAAPAHTWFIMDDEYLTWVELLSLIEGIEYTYHRSMNRQVITIKKTSSSIKVPTLTLEEYYSETSPPKRLFYIE